MLTCGQQSPMAAGAEGMGQDTGSEAGALGWYNVNRLAARDKLAWEGESVCICIALHWRLDHRYWLLLLDGIDWDVIIRVL